MQTDIHTAGAEGVRVPLTHLGGGARYDRTTLRRLAFIRASQSVGVPLALIGEVGCLSFEECALVYPGDARAAEGPGAHLLDATAARRRASPGKSPPAGR